MLKYNKKSIASKLSMAMIIVIFAQILLLVSGLAFSGIMPQLTQNTYNLFDSKVANRRDYVETELTMRFANVTSYGETIESQYNTYMDTQQETPSEDINAFLGQTAISLVEMIRSSIATGGFIILQDMDGSETRSGIYLLDDDPLFNHINNQDITMINGPTEISRQLSLKLHGQWNYGITLDETNQYVFDNPFYAKNTSDDPAMVGYWGVGPSLMYAGANMITYSIPLVDEHGNNFGVLGVNLDQAHLYKMLPADELSQYSSLGYFLAVHNTDTGEIKPVILDGMHHRSILDKDSALEFEQVSGSENTHIIHNATSDDTIIGCVQPLQLYNHNAPFENEQWLLIGLAEQENLLCFTYIFSTTLVIILGVSILFCALISFWVGSHLTKPIIKLSKNVAKNDLYTAASLGRTGFSEIDALSVAIENRNIQILDGMLKTDKIIGMVNLPLGTFEFVKESLCVTCSDVVRQLMGFDCAQCSQEPLDATLFFDELDHIRSHVEDAKNNIYLANENPAKWLKIVCMENTDTIFGIVMDVTDEVLNSHAIKFERDYDALTSVYNRYAFHRNVQDLFLAGVKNVAACVMFDLDNLKYINDTYGHDMGDNYIKLTAKILSDVITSNAIVARMSGDEFYVFFHSYDSKDGIRACLKDVYVALDKNQLLLPTGKKIKIRMSGGIAWYGEDSSGLDNLLRYADFAMYQGKNTVKGEIREFNKASYEAESFMLSGREELNTVLDNQLIDYVFQPIVSAKTGEIYGYEALMRPQSEILSSPLKLIQLATAQSQLWKVEKITFFKALALYGKHRDLFNHCKYFINSIPNETLKPDEIKEIEVLYGHFLQNLVIEITENEKLDDCKLSIKRELSKKWGAKIALDDYGSGYNGDISLISIEPDIVKIDIMLIQNIHTDRNRQSIVQKLIQYAKEQNMIVLAEGVETANELEYLIHAGVDLFQGYYVSYPLPLPNFDTTKIAAEIQTIYNETSHSRGL